MKRLHFASHIFCASTDSSDSFKYYSQYGSDAVPFITRSYLRKLSPVVEYPTCTKNTIIFFPLSFPMGIAGTTE